MSGLLAQRFLIYGSVTKKRVILHIKAKFISQEHLFWKITHKVTLHTLTYVVKLI